MQRVIAIRIGYVCWLVAAPLFLLLAPIESWSEEPPPEGAPAPETEAIRLSGAAPLELEEVLRAFSRVMEVPILWDPDDDRIAEGRVVLGHTMSVPRSQLAPALRAVLEVHALKVVPAAAEGLAGWRVVPMASQTGLMTAYVPLLEADVSHVAPLLRSQFEDGGSPVRISSDPRSNTVIIQADPGTMKRVRVALLHLDIHVDRHVPQAILHALRPKHVPPADLLRALRPHLRSGATCWHAVRTRSAPAPICSLGPLGHAIVCTATERQWEQIHDLLRALDTPSTPKAGPGAVQGR